jgi:hypothetical protein
MDEEQLYYKEKYFKYKLKYLTLKEELEGGFKVSNPFASKKPATTAEPAPAPAPAPAPTVTEKKVSSSSPDEILTFLRELLDPKHTEKTIHKVDGQRWDTAITYNYRIKKLIDEEMGQRKYNLSIFEDIENMLSPVLKTANDKGYLLDIGKLKTYLRHNLKKKFFT